LRYTAFTEISLSADAATIGTGKTRGNAANHMMRDVAGVFRRQFCAILWRDRVSSVLLIALQTRRRQQAVCQGHFSDGKLLCPWQNFGIFSS